MSDDLYKSIFSKNLRYYMELRGKTQSDIVNDLHYDKSTVSTWVLGTRLPRMDKVNALAQYLHCKRSDLIEDHSAKVAVSVNDLSDHAIQIAIAYDRADERSKVAVEVALGIDFLGGAAVPESSGSEHLRKEA